MTDLATRTPSPSISNRNSTAVDVALVVLRVGLGLDFMAHGSQKLFSAFGGTGLSGTAGFFDSLGAHPGMLWAIVGAIVEFGGGIALVVGLFVRLAGIGLAVDMILAIALYNAGHGFFVAKGSDGWEINYVIALIAVALIVAGPGRFALAAMVRGDGTSALRRRIAML